MTQDNRTVELQDAHVVAYLQEHPDFFERQAALLNNVRLSSGHTGRTISLQERQMEVMREKHRTLESRLAELIHIARDNDAIVEKMHQWTRELLRAGDDAARPDIVVRSLETTFNVPQVALRLWGCKPAFAGLAVAAAVPVETVTLVNSMQAPYCGMNSDFQPATWLPGKGTQARSIALLPLRQGAGAQAFGLLVLGSPDPERFKASMQTAYLARIAETASAALARLVE